jgi:uncharacterized protein (DUF1330 family)
MAGYLIANIEVTDPAGFEEYRQKVASAAFISSGMPYISLTRRAN